MSYEDEGFVPRTIAEIIDDYEKKAQGIFETNDFSASSLLWQQMKVHALDSHFFETLLETAADQMSITNAVGIFLDKHGINLGIKRKGAQKAEGYVEVTTSTYPFTLTENTVFASSLNNYLSDDEVTIETNTVVTKTRTGESYDYFTSDIPYLEDVLYIRDENNNKIASGLWTFDATYHNNIHWIDASSGLIIKDEQYTVYFDGDVRKRIEVTSEGSGATANARVGEITQCVTYPSLVTYNYDAVSGAIDQESDDSYRQRLLAAQNRNFTLNKVRSLALGIDGVRSAKVWQDVGTDQTSVADWDSPTLGANVTLDQYERKYSQKFVPGDQVLSLGKIVLKGRSVNAPPDIRCGVKQDTDETGLTAYFDIVTFTEEDLSSTVTGFQDLELNLKYNGLDKTKTYRFDLWLNPPEDGITGIDFTTNYWELRTSSEQYGGANTRYDLLENISGTWTSLGSSVDLMFKTQFHGAAYTVQLAPNDGYGFENLKTELEGMLDYVDGGGLSPIGIQYVIEEPDEVLVDIRGIIYVTALADFQDVREDVITNIEEYLESLDAGDDVIYSRIEYEIMKHPNVYKQKNIYIKRNDVTEWAQRDVSILDTEIADLGTRSLQRGL